MTDLPQNPTAEAPGDATAFLDGVPLARPVLAVDTPAPSAPSHEMKLDGVASRAALLDVCFFVALVATFELVFGAVVGAVLGVPHATNEPDASAADLRALQAMLLPTLAVRATVCFGVIGMILRLRGQSFRSVGFVTSAFGWNLLIGVGVTISAYLLWWITYPLLWLAWPAIVDDMRANAQKLTEMIPRMHAGGFAAIALIVGVYEELVFRGFLMTRLRRATRSWTIAVVLTTAVFTALHGLDQTRGVLIWITILALVLSVATIWRGSLIPAIVGHILFDLSQLIGLSWYAGDSWK